jgi:hypothetical protein
MKYCILEYILFKRLLSKSMRFGAEEARQAHNLEVARSKLAIATFFFSYLRYSTYAI